MKIKILKSAGVLVKNEVMVVQIGKIMEVNKSLGNHLIKTRVAKLYEETKEEIPQTPITPQEPEQIEDVIEKEETEVE